MRIVGLMTGTSLDGIDAALVRVTGVGRRLRIATEAFETTPYPADLRERVAAVLASGAAPLAELAELHGALGRAYAEAVAGLCARAGVPLAEVDAVGSHGQTFWHAPNAAVPATLQLGEAAWIAEATGLTVVSDFRPADVAAGGQGAPLVPYLDMLLFERLGPGTVALNLGGVANVTILGPEGPVAFDTGPGMALIDEAARRASGGALPYDADGRLAAAGTANEAAVAAWLEEEAYFRAAPPKSTGRELFGAARFAALERDARARFDLALASPDGVATLVRLTAESVALGLRRFSPAAPARLRSAPRLSPAALARLRGAPRLSPAALARLRGAPRLSPAALGFSPTATARLRSASRRAPKAGSAPGAPLRVVVSGGGLRHPGLMRALAAALPGAAVESSAAHGVDPDAKEAVAFAVLARQALLGEPNVEPRATGARRAVTGGKITPGRNFGRVLLKAREAAALTTEGVHPDALAAPLDAVPLALGARLFQQADAEALAATEALAPAIAALAARAAEAFRSGGRLLYAGAGTSGRLGVLDASECPPTFSVPPERVQGLIAGGEPALTRAVEGAEDDREAGARAVQELGVGAHDVVLGLSANGRAPFVWGALAAARAAGAATGLLCCNAFERLGAPFRPDFVLEAPVGPEVLAGSSRLKAGTATKLVLNRVSTLAMAASGRLWGPYMVEVSPGNAKLRRRAAGLVAGLGRVGEAEAAALLEKSAWRVKPALLMARLGCDVETAETLLQQNEGRLSDLLGPP